MSSLEHQYKVETAQPFEARTTDGAGHHWFDQFSLTRKLNYAVFGNTLVLALVAATLLIGTFYLGQGGHRQAMIASIEVRTNNAAIAMVEVVDSLEAADDGQGDTSASIRRAGDALDLAYDTLTDPIEFAGDRMPADVGPKINGFRDRVDALRDDLGTETSAPRDLARVTADAKALFRDMSTFAVAYHEDAAASADELFASISNFLMAFVVLVIIGVGVSLFLARAIIRNLVFSIRGITDTMQRLADGDTESHIPGRTRRDELGDMARALTVFQSSSLALRDLTAERARDAEDQLANEREAFEAEQRMREEQSALLDNLAQGFEYSVGEVISAVQSAADTMRATSKDMVALAQGSVSQSQEASAAMDNATRNVTAAAAATDEFALSISEISRQASASANLAREASDLVRNANTKMTDLSQAAQEIGEIASLIQTIAQRTNLLALNASIEAARGGEAGRGFAVVASEVKELANQTSNATSSVAEKIAAMQSSTEASAGDLTSIVDQIRELEEAAVVIAAAVDQQSISGEDLARNIDTVANGSAKVAGRLEDLRNASQDTGEAAGGVLSNAEALSKQADALQAKAGRFIADVRRSSRDLATQGKTGK